MNYVLSCQIAGKFLMYLCINSIVFPFFDLLPNLFTWFKGWVWILRGININAQYFECLNACIFKFNIWDIHRNHIRLTDFTYVETTYVSYQYFSFRLRMDTSYFLKSHQQETSIFMSRYIPSKYFKLCILTVW